MEKQKKQRIALVLSGGGAQGAAEIGFYQALIERGIKPDYIVGTSVGAINGAFIASGMEVEQLIGLWKEISNRKLYRLNPELLWKWSKASSLFKPVGLKRFLRNRLPVHNFEELAIPLTVVATDLQKPGTVCLDTGTLLPALMASSALPVYFPPQVMNGSQLIDGGITDNIPVEVAYNLGADVIYCMLTECRCRFRNTISGLFEMLVRTIQVNQHEKLDYELRKIATDREAELYVLDLCINTHLNGLLDFSKTETIIEEAYLFSRRALEQGYGCFPLRV